MKKRIVISLTQATWDYSNTEEYVTVDLLVYIMAIFCKLLRGHIKSTRHDDT